MAEVLLDGRSAAAAQPLSGPDDVHAYVARVCFKTGPPGPVGVESEWLVTDSNFPERHVPLDEVELALDGCELPGGSTVSFEPGGQFEFSSAVARNAETACAAVSADHHAVSERLRSRGLSLSGAGLDPLRAPRRLLRTSRYDAMERFFDGDGPAGRVMMNCTAATQVCLECGSGPDQIRDRWELVHALQPVLVAAFANSPMWLGSRTGLRCTRQAIWSAIDPSRTARPAGRDPLAAWAEYALDARLIAIRRDEGPWSSAPGITFRQWLAGPTPFAPPTEDDLAFHLSTLFPPVRPHGWLEVRYLDGLPPGAWEVAVAVTTALVDDPMAAAAARAAAEPVAQLTGAAIREAVADPELAKAARCCFDAALGALKRQSAGYLYRVVDAYAERYLEAGRCPADDLLGRTPEREAVTGWSRR